MARLVDLSSLLWPSRGVSDRCRESLVVLKWKAMQTLQQSFSGNYVTQFDDTPLNRLSRLLPYFDLKRSDVVVDYACGSAKLLPLIYPSLKGYVGVDFSSDFIELATKKAVVSGFQNARFELSDLGHFGNANPDAFDKAFAFDLGNFLSKEEYSRIFKGIFSSLKSGGVLYYHEPNGGFFLERLRDTGLIGRNSMVVKVRTRREIEALLGEAGFRDIKVTMLSHYLKPLSYFHVLSRLPLGIGKLFEARIFLSAQK